MGDVFWEDCRHALVGLRRSPRFALAAVTTLALSLGAAVTLFSLLNALILRTLPVPKPEQLIYIGTVLRNGGEAPLSFPMFRELSGRQSSLATTVGWFGDPILTLGVDGGLTQGTVIGVSGNFYSELGAAAATGRLLQPSDVDLSSFTGEQVAVIGHGFWRRRFGGSQHAIGSVVRVEGIPFVVVGVAPPNFKGLGLLAEPDVTVPLTAYPSLFRSDELRYAISGNVLWMRMAARLRSGATVEQARADLEALWPHIKSEIVPASHAGAQREAFLGLRLLVRPLATGLESFLRPRFTRSLQLLLGIALLLLLIACANLAQLVLVRVAERSHELAVLMALGASRTLKK